MSWSPTKITCKCGATLETRWTSELKDWQDRHDVCLETTKDEALKLALEALQWSWGGEPLPTLELKAITAINQVLGQPEPPPECTTEAEKKAFAFGWWKAMEAQRKDKNES